MIFGCDQVDCQRANRPEGAGQVHHAVRGASGMGNARGHQAARAPQGQGEDQTQEEMVSGMVSCGFLTACNFSH